MRKKIALMGLMTAAIMLVASLANGTVSLANGTGKVAVDSAKIRESADQGSSVVGSATKGNTVTIIEECKDNSGTVWYKVMVDANKTGYVRSDLITVTDAAGIGQTDDGAENAADGVDTSADMAVVTGDSPAETQMDAQYANVKVEAAKMRTAPSTSDSVVEALSQGTEMIVTGQSNGSDGKVWYYATLAESGKSGFIRSDLVTLGDMVPQPEVQEEEAPVEEVTSVEPEQTISNDYEAVYTTDDTGAYTWYLYDNVEGTRQKLEDVLTAAHAQNTKANANAKKVVKQRIVIIVLAVLLAIAIVAIVVLLFRLRDVEYEDVYEDEEEEDPRPARRKQVMEEEMPARRRQVVEEEMPVRRRQVVEETPVQRPRRTEENYQPVSREVQASGARAEQVRTQQSQNRPQQAGARAQQAGARAQQAGTRSQQPGSRVMQEDRVPRRRPQEVSYEDEMTAPVKEAPKRRAKNFLDNDEFEYEYLDMNDNNE